MGQVLTTLRASRSVTTMLLPKCFHGLSGSSLRLGVGPSDDFILPTKPVLILSIIHNFAD